VCFAPSKKRRIVEASDAWSDQFHYIDFWVVDVLTIYGIGGNVPFKSPFRYSDPMGDPVCFLVFTCLECGRFLDPDERERAECSHCGAELIGSGQGQSTKPVT
jgi:DNA-directed RNA polymerase subunit RPC12/RpoP